MSNRISHPGAYPSPRDSRDWLHKNVSKTLIRNIPAEGGIDEVPLIIHDQEDLPTCTGEAGSYLQMINQYFETGQMVDLSPMFLYKMNREIDGLPPETEGSTVKATVQTLRIRGVCREILFPSTRANYERALPGNRQLGRILRNAYQNRIVAYTKCLDLDDILTALAEKKPVIFSMYLLSNFYKARRGLVPASVGGDNIGGHAMVALKYNLDERWVKVTQSWGRSSPLTDKGYMYIPFDWFTYNVKPDFPMLMEAYTVLDYIPEEAKQMSSSLALSKLPVKIEVNNEVVKDLNIQPILINETGIPLVRAEILEKVFESLTGQKVKVTWNQDDYVLKINI
ncbi:MAG: C1 family peptidase [Peptococcaceae bacterium]